MSASGGRDGLLPKSFHLPYAGIDLLEVASVGPSGGNERRSWTFPIPFLLACFRVYVV
ncbi:hypothetical protein MANES_01G058450v8 [Manihot esculenta]|uniref:Uncharacterized protein n=1 Tax=Manihot esculenta TaxID=3983 RepID=A0ACC8E6N3_MANES|nr:hypothetical protein MANES_01G058450v8 [Manihot esculenta]